MKKIKRLYLWSNGMVMAFDDNGEQIPEFQGKAKDVLGSALDALSDRSVCYMGQWSERPISVTPEALRGFAEQFEE